MKHMLCLLVVLLSLSACGKRASMMEPAPDVDPQGYDNRYPDARTDPPGTYNP